MQKKQNSLFSTKGFYLGVGIFTFGLCLMIARVVLDIMSIQEPTNTITEEQKPAKEQTSKLDNNLQRLQEKLDEKIKEQELINKKDFSLTIEDNYLTIFNHNPTNNKNGIINAIEFIDFGCSECLLDANFVQQVLKNNSDISLTSKLTNISTTKELHLANLAALIAAEQNKFFEFKHNLLKSNTTDLNSIVETLSTSGVSLREFRNILTKKSDILLSHLAKDIAQSEKLKINSYAIFINNRMFSDTDNSKYNLKDIPLYLNNELE